MQKDRSCASIAACVLVERAGEEKVDWLTHMQGAKYMAVSVLGVETLGQCWVGHFSPLPLFSIWWSCNSFCLMSNKSFILEESELFTSDWYRYSTSAFSNATGYTQNVLLQVSRCMCLDSYILSPYTQFYWQSEILIITQSFLLNCKAKLQK